MEPRKILGLFAVLFLAASGGAAPRLPAVPFSGKPALIWHGMASWYSRADRGIRRRTASGEVFDDKKHTCASWDYPFHAHLRVTNVKNGKSVVCRVNDRGPSKRFKKRKIDLTRTAFKKIAKLDHGLAKVSIVRVKK